MEASDQTSICQMLEVQANLDLEFYDLQNGLDSARSNNGLRVVVANAIVLKVAVQVITAISFSSRFPQACVFLFMHAFPYL